MKDMIRPLLVVLLGSLIACGDRPGTAPVHTLVEADPSLQSPLNEAVEAAWLGAGRFGVVSPSDDRVALIDFGAGTSSLVSGDSTIRHPSHVFARDDTLFISDWGLARVTAWVDGTRARTIVAEPRTAGALARAIDDDGRLYYEVAPDPGPDGRGNRDSAAIVQVTPGAATVDTVARLAPLDIAAVTTDQGPRWERRVFSGDDEWGVLGDGSIWIARNYHNRVDWRDPGGAWHQGRQLPDRILEVTDTDRERFLARFPSELRATAERLPFAPLKAPFVRAFGTANGTVWIEKSRHIADTLQAYHVVDRSGRFVQEYHVNGWGRVLTASDGAALVARTDTIGYQMRLAKIEGGRTVGR